MLLLTRCAGCAADLTNVVPRSAAKQCGRCKTPYCGRACQEQHWKEGGHDTICKKIKRGGGAEQYHADTKYKEAVAVAVEACAEDVLTLSFEEDLQTSRELLASRETPPGSA